MARAKPTKLTRPTPVQLPSGSWRCLVIAADSILAFRVKGDSMYPRYLDHPPQRNDLRERRRLRRVGQRRGSHPQAGHDKRGWQPGTAPRQSGLSFAHLLPRRDRIHSRADYRLGSRTTAEDKIKYVQPEHIKGESVK